ncbi:dienelactone hydrolase family protein [Acuticoccus yangtzensis]|uniref:dienelactone hydrolase family protein n=1 Tax=Acuticoccus yangtzensis TaxID=1443441 RepID=UPI0009496FCB|nr:dienelactone hydrolase family protein [Acuticoccus yangtzensis]
MDDVSYETVRIPTANPFVLADHDPSGKPVPMAAELYKPATLPGPFPAVVVSEGLGGVKTVRERRYGRFLAQHGFVALVVDSFKTRGFHKAAHPIRAVNVTESMMLADAFAGLTWLADRPDVDPARIYNIGFSYGGMISILTAYEQIRRLFVASDEKFAAHVSYYGPTVPRLEDYRTTGAPVAILNGELDENFDPKRLELIAGDLKNGGSLVENVVFPDTYHQWDSDDLKRRFDPFNIKALGVWIDPDNKLFDERNGRQVKDFKSRLMMIAGSVSLKGFHLLRDPEIMQKSDRILLNYLSIPADDPEALGKQPSVKGEAAPPMPPERAEDEVLAGGVPATED